MKRQARHNRKSVPFFQSLSNGRGPALHIYMFANDVHLGVMPIGGHSYKHPEFKVQFEGEKIDNEKAIQLCSSLAEFDRHNDCELICDVINTTANYLSWEGRAVYEIIREAEQPCQISLLHFTSRRLYKVPGYYIQWAPSADRKFTNKRFVILPAQDVWEISMPKILGGTKGYQKILNALKRYDRPSPEFWLNDIQKQVQTLSFNFQDYVRNKEIYDARVTRDWGWNRRDLSLKYQTEFFMFYRIVTFRWTQAVLREHITNELNRLFQRLTINSQIIINGLPAANEILKIRKDLVEGKIQFTKAPDLSSVM